MKNEWDVAALISSELETLGRSGVLVDADTEAAVRRIIELQINQAIASLTSGAQLTMISQLNETIKGIADSATAVVGGYQRQVQDLVNQLDVPQLNETTGQPATVVTFDDVYAALTGAPAEPQMPPAAPAAAATAAAATAAADADAPAFAASAASAELQSASIGGERAAAAADKQLQMEATRQRKKPQQAGGLIAAARSATKSTFRLRSNSGYEGLAVGGGGKPSSSAGGDTANTTTATSTAAISSGGESGGGGESGSSSLASPPGSDDLASSEDLAGVEDLTYSIMMSQDNLIEVSVCVFYPATTHPRFWGSFCHFHD